MKKYLALLLVLVMVLSLAACASKTEPAADTTTAEPAAEPAETTEETPAAEEETPAAEEEAPAADDVKHVVYIVNGNLGDKSFFDSCESGLAELQAAGRITYTTIEMGGTDADQPTWKTTLEDVSASGEYDLIICGTYQMPDYLKEVATQYPDQLYLIFDDNTYAGNNSNVVNITYKQNDMGYLVGTYAACMTTDTNLDKINEDAVIGFVGGVDSPVINDFLTGFIEGALAVNPDIDTIGLLYDLSQDASTQAIADAKAFCDSKGIKYIEKNGTTTAEVQMAAEALIAAGVKAVFTPTDNTVMTAELSIYETFLEAGVMHFTGADSFALNGAFVGYGVDYVQLGEATADMVVELLCEGKTTADLPYQTFDNGIVTINTETAAALGMDDKTLEMIKEAFKPYCTEIVEVTTQENF